jgi:nitrite reductase/ring-hydroxylating ferredoxin subunit
VADLKPLIRDRTYLKHFWHPVCTLKQLEQNSPEGNGPFAATLLDEDIVIARLGDELVALRDQCAHRLAKLSVGLVVGGKLQCPYHGWQYEAAGNCVHIPACPDEKIPARAVTEKYDCAVKYNLVWVRLDRSWDCTEIPYCSAWENPEYKRVIVPDPYSWDSSAERRWENFTDFSHFPFVHPGTLYDPAYKEPEIVDIDREGGELRFKLEPGREMIDNLPPDSPLGSFSYRAAMPYTINLEIHLYQNDKPFLLWTTSSPVSENICRNFMVIAHTDTDAPDDQPVGFQKIVLAEDQPVIESQPGSLYIGEMSLPTDKISNQYRRWLRELSEAAVSGEEAFRKSLQTDVIESGESS